MPTKEIINDKPSLLSLLPVPEQPNIVIHTNLFGPMLRAGQQNKYILCVTDAFTKHVLVTPMENKEAKAVAVAIFSERFCKFGLPTQIHIDGRKSSSTNC